MGKDHGGPLTAKAIGKKIKSKGLQKLKFYCQMCQKQCRDANGFKCHMTSEAHQRQLLLFAENPNKYLGSYSDEFLKPFLYLLKTRFGTRRVAINTVYQEYIKDRDHTHLNATRWVTLTGLAKWLGRKGICDVEETEKGWMVTYIDRDPETLKRQENRNKKEKLDKDYEERISQIIDEQIERGKQAEQERKNKLGESSTSDPSNEPSTSTKEFRTDDDKTITKVAFSLNIPKTNAESHTKPSALTSLSGKRKSSKQASSSSTSKKSALEELKEEQEAMKSKKMRKDHWLIPGIVVKVITKSLGDKYYKKKGNVIEVIEKYEGVIEMLDTKDKIKLDQAHVETVIPNVGKQVKIVNGPYRDASAKLLCVDFSSFCCKVQIESGPFMGRILDKIPYEDICKTA